MLWHKRVRRPGIEPGASRWQRDILPLNQRRLVITYPLTHNKHQLLTNTQNKNTNNALKTTHTTQHTPHTQHTNQHTHNHTSISTSTLANTKTQTHKLQHTLQHETTHNPAHTPRSIQSGSGSGPITTPAVLTIAVSLETRGCLFRLLGFFELRARRAVEMDDSATVHGLRAVWSLETPPTDRFVLISAAMRATSS